MRKYCFPVVDMKREVALKKVSFFYFILLFPGFFFYHYAVARAYVPPVLGGYFGVVALSGLFTFLALTCRQSFGKTNSIELVFFLILLWTALVVCLNLIFDSPSGYSREMFVWSVSGIVFNALMFMLGRYLDFERSCLYFVMLFAMALVVLLNVGGSGIFYVKLEAGDVAESVATYQGFGRSLLIVALMLSAVAFRKGYYFFLVVLVSLVSLFFNGARTEFLLYSVSLVCLYAFYIKKDGRLLLQAIPGLFFIGLCCYVVLDHIPNSRMLQLLDVTSASSMQARIALFDFSIKEVFGSLGGVIFGSYGAYTSIGGVGSYPHNLFSAWVNLGIFGIFLYALLLAFLWVYVLIWYARCSNGSLYRVYLCFLIYLTLALLASKSYSYMFLGFVVGIHSQLYSVVAGARTFKQEAS